MKAGSKLFSIITSFVLAAGMLTCGFAAGAEEAFAGENGTSMNIYGLYMKRASGTANSNDRYGDAILLESNGEYLLMDTGAKAPIKNDNTIYKSTLVNSLKAAGVEKLDVYISHLHGDHTGGLQWVCDEFDVGTIYLPDTEIAKDYQTPNTDKTIARIYEDQFKIAEKEGANVVFLSPSFRNHQQDTIDSFMVGDAQVKVIGPVGNYTIQQFASVDGDCGSKEGHYLNSYSLTSMITCGGVKFLTCGDIEKQEENALVNKYGNGLNADIVKINHHGLKTSNTTAFHSKVSAAITIAEDHGYSSGSTKTSFTNVGKYSYNFPVATKKQNMLISVNNGKIKVCADANNNCIIDETPFRGWKNIAGRYQYYDGAGVLAIGWKNVGSSKYYFNPATSFRFTGTHTIKGTKCVFSSAGALKTPARPAKVRTRSAKSGAAGAITVKWRKAKGTSYYEIYRSGSKSGSYKYVGKTAASQRYFTDRGLTSGKTYYYKIRSVKSFSGTTRTGKFSSARKAVSK